MTNRLHALDALRGCLCVVVAVCHILSVDGETPLRGAATLAVWIFFAMSAYVLGRSYDGRYATFLARRAIRLWPVYGACVAVGAILIGRMPSLGEWLWWPGAMRTGVVDAIDQPAWSLFVEAAATPFLPLAFRIGRSRAGAVLLLGAAAALWTVTQSPWALWAGCFALGVALLHVRIDWPARVPAPLVWLGTISYSLYLSHFVVLGIVEIGFGPSIGRIVAGPAMLLVAWAVWRLVERPSTAWSRAVALPWDRFRRPALARPK